MTICITVTTCSLLLCNLATQRVYLQLLGLQGDFVELAVDDLQLCHIKTSEDRGTSLRTICLEVC